MTITPDKLRRWASTAACTRDGVKCLDVETLLEIANHIDAMAACIAELEFIRNSADQLQKEYAEALGCAGDNESILEAIDAQASNINRIKRVALVESIGSELSGSTILSDSLTTVIIYEV